MPAPDLCSSRRALRPSPAFPMPVRAMGWRTLRGVALLAAGAALSAMAAPTDANQVIVPNAKPGETSSASVPSGTTAFTFMAIVALAGAGAWLVWRGRVRGPGGMNRVAKHLSIEETRSLGSRQYLVVAAYQDKKFLLSVCPGRIDLLTSLTPTPPSASSVEKLRA